MLKPIPLCLAVALIASTAVAQTAGAKSPCRFVTVEEATAILGSRPEAPAAGNNVACSYSAPKRGLTVEFSDRGNEATEHLALYRQMFGSEPDYTAKAGGALKDEPSLGTGA